MSDFNKNEIAGETPGDVLVALQPCPFCGTVPAYISETVALMIHTHNCWFTCGIGEPEHALHGKLSFILWNKRNAKGSQPQP
jgi:hypothetical protein